VTEVAGGGLWLKTLRTRVHRVDYPGNITGSPDGSTEQRLELQRSENDPVTLGKRGRYAIRRPPRRSARLRLSGPII
jgi:hypothetical protein